MMPALDIMYNKSLCDKQRGRLQSLKILMTKYPDQYTDGEHTYVAATYQILGNGSPLTRNQMNACNLLWDRVHD